MKTILIAAPLAATLIGLTAGTADAYTAKAAPVLTEAVCADDGQLTVTWNTDAGKPRTWTISSTEPYAYTVVAGGTIPKSALQSGVFAVPLSGGCGGYRGMYFQIVGTTTAASMRITPLPS